MCDISPFSMKCVFDDCKDDAVQCLACRMRFYLQQLRFSLPVIGKLFENREDRFVCPYFEPLEESKMESNNEKYIHVVMQDGKELVYLDHMHMVEFDGHWLTIKGGFRMNEIVFATHANNMQYMYVDK